MDTQFYHGDSNLTLTSWRNVQMQFFSGPMLASHIPLMHQARAAICAAYPASRVLSLTTILPGSGVPAPAVRQSIATMLTSFNKTTLASAYIIEGQGLGAAAVRTFVSVMFMAARSPHHHGVFEHQGPAVKWAVREANLRHCTLPEADFLAAVMMFRNQIPTSHAQHATG